MKKSRKIIFTTIIVLTVIVLVAGFYFVQASGNRRQSFHTGELLIDQIEVMLERNMHQEKALMEGYKEDYITRARAVSYIIDHEPMIGADSEELRKIANLVSVDEIFLFDVGGTIYSGTSPRFIGLNMDSGEQIAFFKPMLKDRTLAMCQDIEENTGEGKLMMYAMCWSEHAERMVQVGVVPTKLIEDMKANSVGKMVEGMVSQEGLYIIVADSKTGTILGSTYPEYKGLVLSKLGVDTSDTSDYYVTHKIGKADGHPSYISYKNYKTYTLFVAQTYSSVNENIRRGMIMMTAYVIIASVMLYLVVRNLTLKIIKEHDTANSDQMTGFYNRRAYETDVLKYNKTMKDKEFVYVSMDLNGLKVTNDTLGHDAGDKLISGAGECMKKSFGKYGRLYRIGGDEFAALITPPPAALEDLKIEFKKRIRTWSETNGLVLSVSCGYVKSSDHPGLTTYELAKLADNDMYREKEAYYKMSGNDRRGRRPSIPTEAQNETGN